MQTTTEPNATSTAAEYRQYMGGFFQLLLAPHQTGGTMALLDFTVPRGAEPPPHVHTQEDEMFYMLEGEVHFHIGDNLIKAVPGAAVFAPRGVPHHFSIQTPTARFLTLITPGQFTGYFMDNSFPVAVPQVVPPQGPPPAELIQHMVSQLGQKYGVFFL